jgi:acylphosphatase
MCGSEAALITRHLRITGSVQGVGYRWNMAQEARRLGVNGWVRNRLDGSVEAVVSGSEDVVLVLIEWVQQGPPLAKVDGVTLNQASGEFSSFDQRDKEPQR